MARQITASIYCAGTLLAPAQDIQSLTLHQNLFGHHQFEVAVPFDNVEGPGEAFFSQAHKRLLGQLLTIELVADSFHFNQGQTCRFKGLVTNIATSKDTDYVGSILVRGFSPSYLLTDGLQRRTFVQRTLADIFQQVLHPYPGNVLSHRLQPQHTAPLPFVVQYDETNFDFLSRLATEYGEWFYYDGATLCLGAPPAGAEQEFVADGAYNTFTFGMAVKPVKAQFYEYNYQKNEQFHSSTSAQQVPGIQGHPFGGFALAQSEQLFTDELHLSAETLIAGLSELNAEAKQFKANAAAELVTLEGSSDNPALLVGGVIRVSGEGLGSRHLTAESFGTYRLLRLTHQVDAQGNYRNQFAAVPYFVHVPPPLPGYAAPAGQPELAEVIDEADPQQLGRLRVRYYWPVARPQDAETDWLRVLTPYSGQGKGYLMKPEVGSQVLVAYQGSLAEQPFVLGNLFHAKNPQGAKYSPAQNNLKGIQTAGGNKVVMQDAQGAQSIHLSNSNNKGTAIQVSFQGDGSITIQSNGPITVNGHTITLQAKEDVLINAGRDIKLTAKSYVGMTAKEADIQLSADQHIKMIAKQNVVVEATEKMELTAKTAALTGRESAGLLSPDTVDVGQGTTVNVSAAVINQS